jgi:RNA-binding protein
MKNLTIKQKQYLKALAHNIDPVVFIGDKGLTDSVIKEINTNLKAHELIKIRIFGDDKDYRKEIIEQINSQVDAAMVQHIGKLLVLFKSSEKSKIILPLK